MSVTPIPARKGRAFLFVLTIFVLSVAAPELYAAGKNSLEPSRDSIIRIVTQIQRADYEGDRPALKRLHDELPPIPEDNKLASQVLYWRGFALWRRAINGFNESRAPTDLDEDLTQAVTDFKDAIARNPAFVEPKIGAVSSLGYLMYLNKKDPTRVQELLQQLSPLLKEATAAAPNNPRLLWVLGPIRWSSPPDRGGGQDKAFESYNRGLEAVRNQKGDASDPLEPSWGEPELLMSLAWSNLNRTTPDLNAAEQDAQAALEIVPYWHYVRDILMPQIRAAQAKVLLPEPKFTPAQQEVLDARKARVEAGKKRDGSWSRYVADDCIYSDDDGNLVTKAQQLEHEKRNWPPEYDHSVNFREYVVHVYGDTAVMNFRFTVHEQITDTDLITEMRATEAYAKQNGTWLLVARQWASLPINFRKPVAVDTSVYKDYVGQYQSRPLDDVETISLKDGKLWSQSGNDENEYLPLGPETFFIKNDIASITFSRDPQGHVTGYTYHREDGQDYHVKKIK
jgi:ketosteroid isomerase-like protein